MSHTTSDVSPGDLDPGHRMALYRATYEDLPTFIDVVFSESFDDGLVRGDWILHRGEFLQSHNKTCFIGPRNHFKSTGFYAHFLWQVWRCRFHAAEDAPWAKGDPGLEAHYFSYKEKSAGYHIGQAKDSIKSLIERNPYFESLKDQKPNAETKGLWSWDGTHEISLDPHGMLSHTRGIHADLVYVDDPFQDPEDKLDPTKVLKINDVFKAVVRSIPTTERDQIHVATTPQTEEDFPFDANLMSDYHREIQPAINEQGQPIWPEWKDLEELEQIKQEIGPKLYNQEYLCQPASSEVSFLKTDEIKSIEVPHLTDWGETAGRDLQMEEEWTEGREWLEHCTGVVAGLDIGKKRHPSHLAVFAVLPSLSSGERSHTLVQLHSRWMDSWDYVRQADYCQKAIRYFDIDSMAYDATRGEFESIEEMGQLPDEMQGVTLTGKSKNEMAGYLDTLASTGRLKLLPDGRQRRQLSAVTQDLKAVETAEGHGESFTSIGLACRESQTHSFGSNFGTLEM